MSDAFPGMPPEGPQDLEPKRSRLGLIAGGLAVLAAAGGLAWWLTADAPDAPQNVSAAQVAQAQQSRSQTPLLASASADESQVRRAYEQFQTVYADLGAPGLASFSQNCAKAVGGDPRILDYCLAFDAYATSVAAEEPWFADADYRHVELARTALPAGTDPAQRIVEVARLTRVATRAPAPAAAPAEPIVVAEAPPVAPTPAVVAKTTPAPVVVAKAAPPAPAPAPVVVAKAEPPLRKSLSTPSRPIVAKAEKAAAAPVRAKVQKAAAPAKAKPAKLQKASAPARKRAADRCRFEPTPAARALCANPSLKVADRRMKQAYEKAIAAGADRATLDREQAEWRTARNAMASSKDAVARLYDQRIGQLQAHADAPH